MSRGLLYVGDFLGATVTVVDVDAAAVDRTIEMGSVEIEGIPIGMQPDSFALSPDGRTLYLSRFPLGGRLKEIPGADPADGDLIALDVATDEVLWTMPVVDRPNHISISPDGSRLYVPIRSKAHVEVVDVATQTVVGKVNCGWGPHGTKLSPDGRLLYVGNIINHTLAVLDVERLELVQAVPVGAAARPFVVTADGTTAYLQLSGLHGFVVVDLEAGRLAQTVHLPELPLGTPSETTFPYTLGHGMAMTKAEDELWVASTAGGYLAVYAVPSLKLLQIVEVGSEPGYVLLDPTEDVVFGSNRNEDTVSIIDRATRTEQTRVPVGKYPGRLKYVEAKT
jgi:YVTN family beta-propeller protein